MGQPGTVTWFARHEARLAWRDLWAMLTAGSRSRVRIVVIALIGLALAMHVVGFAIVGRFADLDPEPDRAALLVMTGCMLLSWSLMMSQAMESATRAFYARADLDLLLSSPVNAPRVFAVRIAIIAGSTVLMALLVAAPFINVLAWIGGPRWFAAYGAVAAIGAIATAMAMALTAALFQVIGPKRTRLAAQIVSAVIGAFFVIGLQIAAITSYGTMFQWSFALSDSMVARVPMADSLWWTPARAALGDPQALIAFLVIAFTLLAGAIRMFAARFAHNAVEAAGVAARSRTRTIGTRPFVSRTAAATLRRKEWRLLLRDPWLLSQTLMQLLYLLPPALMLWTAFGQGAADVVLLVPVLVMAAGQLAGGLAWLAISGEDAPELVATAPVTSGTVVRAKVEAVIGGVAVIFAPFCLTMAWVSPRDALFAAGGCIVGALASTQIQFWFRTQARRRHFARRQTSSRVATFAEAFSSIAWAAAAGLCAAGHWHAGIVVAAFALILLFIVRGLAPSRRQN